MVSHQNPNEKHLEFIQQSIIRLSGNSFLIKGWSVTLISALFALAANDADIRFVVLAFFPAIIFWFLDGYFLGLERRFVQMYNEAILGNVNPYEIKPHNFTSIRNSLLGALFSHTILPFHGCIIAVIITVMFALPKIV